MTGLARSCRHMSSTRARALAGSVSARSSSISLPWRTSPTPSKPRECRALPIALPCGSRTPDLSRTWTRAFIAPPSSPRLHRPAFIAPPSLHRAQAAQIGRAADRQDAEAAGNLLVAFLDLAEILAEAVLIHLLVGVRVPQPAIVGADLVGDDDAHVVVGVEATEFELEINEPDADPEEKSVQEIIHPQCGLHHLVEIVRAGPAEGGDVLLGDQRVAESVLLQVVLDDRTRQQRALDDTEPRGEIAGRQIAHDDSDRDDLDLT